MPQTPAERLGVVPYGTEDPIIGNFLVYPRRLVLEVLSLAFQQPELFAPVMLGGSDTQRNPFLLKLKEDGGVAPDSRLVLSDFSSEAVIRTESRPRIVVERGAGRFSSFGMAKTIGTGFATGRGLFANIFESSIEIRCVSRVKAESESLALAVGSVLLYFENEIRKKSALHHISPPTIGTTTPEKVDATIDQFNTQVTVAVAQTMSWQKVQLNQTVLQQICVAISAQ
jgi:hypothetical protein